MMSLPNTAADTSSPQNPSPESHPLWRQMLLLALPIILSNISVPLLGLVDTAVVGHLDDAVYLAGVTLGATLFSFLFWGFGFLRMGTTGAVAQAAGKEDSAQVVRLLQQGLLMALAIAACLLLLQPWLVPAGLNLLADDAGVLAQAHSYAFVRIWSAPAVLINYVLMGWFLAQKNSRFTLLMLLLGNGINILLDLIFVLLLGWQVQGVALASVLADYAVLLTGLLLALRQIRQLGMPFGLAAGLSKGLGRLLQVNQQLMLRTWLLLGAMAYFTARGATFGSETLAANAILMQLVLLASYALDGYAHAAEALVGQAEGQRDKRLRNRIVISGGWLSGVSVLGVIVLYALFGGAFVSLMTGLPEVQRLAAQYQFWVLVVPLCAAASYLLDGVYIGLMRTDVMRNAMLLAIAGYLATLSLTDVWENHGLWFSFAVFMLLRSLSMALHYHWRLAGRASSGFD